MRSISTCPPGGVVAVIGPNGSGKSTLFNVITGLVPADSGSIRFHDEEILGLHDYQILSKGIARTFQNIRLFPNLTVLENVLIGQHARLSTGALAAVIRTPGTRRQEKAAVDWAMEILAIFGNRLLPRAGQAVSGLSYANRRRIEIARALASRPRLLLLDEPTAGMNPAETLELAEQIKSAERARPDRAADRAQARCGDHARRHGLCARPRRGDRARHSRTRCGATRRCCAPISAAMRRRLRPD